MMKTLRLALLLGTLGTAAISGLVACAAEQAEDEGGADDLEILFPTMYSAYDGEHTFKIPAKVDGVKKVKWSASPKDAVDLDTQSDGSVLITTRKPGTVKITASAGGLKGTANLTITQATPDDWSLGNERYNNGVTWERGPGGPGGGRGDGGAGRRRGPDPNLACTNCHAAGKQDPVEHTPMQTGGFSDDQLMAIFREGKKPEGVEQRVVMSAERWQRMHQWEMEEEEAKGLIVYLRSLEPKKQGATDFMFGGRGKRGKRGDGEKTN